MVWVILVFLLIWLIDWLWWKVGDIMLLVEVLFVIVGCDCNCRIVMVVDVIV